MGAQQTDQHSKTVTVLLTKYSDWISSVLYYIGGKGYTHASISLEEEQNGCYYSFNYKGFCVETIDRHRHRGVSSSMTYELTVSLDAFERMKERLKFFIEHKEALDYTRLGVFFCFFQIPFRWKQHYFCSQFVAEMLKCSEEIALKKPTALYLPNHFISELQHSPCLARVQYNVV